MKFCPKCKFEKESTKFHKNKSKKDGLSGWCKDCNRANFFENHEQNKEKRKTYYHSNKQKARISHSKWYEKNREKVIEKVSQWQRDNKELVREKNRKRDFLEKAAMVYEVSPKEIRRLYNQACFYCGSRTRIEIDHILPLAKGGAHSVGNLVAACKSCNASKNDSLLVMWKYRNPKGKSWQK
jgi:5-methylcytosine-specific restriction endonuclease McrA